MGWVGTDCLPKFKELKTAGITIRAVTHNPNERKAPVDPDIQKSYSELVDILGLENVSVNRLLHGRALIVDNKALIGSMDLNSDSLSGEHIEFAIYTEDVDVVRSLRAYFEKMFKPLKEK
jgi:phosphatidylserine/phosphatidylglycerophosphate/cardiolipin synthase-like enzyme